MDAMPLNPTWLDISLRLALTLIAGAMLGFDRGVRGHAAGLRTTMLVGLAAAVAMIQCNELLSLSGKTQGSFATMDLMRLPLGILTGVGFIGGGAILRRGEMIRGVTTAATLWLATVIGLCFGGGQIVLGIAGSILGITTLFALKALDLRMAREHRARLVIESSSDANLGEVAQTLAPMKAWAHFLGRSRGVAGDAMRLTYEIAWRQPEIAGAPKELVRRLDERFNVVSFELSSGAPD